MSLPDLLKATLDLGGSDLHLSINSVPQVRVDGQRKMMTGHQFALLLTLAERAGRVLSREVLMDLTKGASLEDFDRSIDVHISRLRAAIEDDPKRPRRILTLRGAGYVFAKEQDR